MMEHALMHPMILIDDLSLDIVSVLSTINAKASFFIFIDPSDDPKSPPIPLNVPEHYPGLPPPQEMPDE